MFVSRKWVGDHAHDRDHVIESAKKSADDLDQEVEIVSAIENVRVVVIGNRVERFFNIFYNTKNSNGA